MSFASNPNGRVDLVQAGAEAGGSDDEMQSPNNARDTYQTTSTPPRLRKDQDNEANTHNPRRSVFTALTG